MKMTTNNRKSDNGRVGNDTPSSLLPALFAKQEADRHRSSSVRVCDRPPATLFYAQASTPITRWAHERLGSDSPTPAARSGQSGSAPSAHDVYHDTI